MLLTIAVLVVGACFVSAEEGGRADDECLADPDSHPGTRARSHRSSGRRRGATTAVAQRPAVAVKIENSIDARPQTGLNSADIVWEEVVEGGVARYLAVFDSKLPPVIGPVRSVRPMDPAIAAPAARPLRVLRRPEALPPAGRGLGAAGPEHGRR